MYRGRKQKFDWTFSLQLGDLLAVILSFPVAFQFFHWILPAHAPAATRAITTLNCVFYGILILLFLRRFNLYGWAVFIRVHLLVKRLGWALVASLAAFVVIRFAVSAMPQMKIFPFLGVHLVVVYSLLLGGRCLIRFINTRIVDGISVERIAFIGWSPRLERVLQSLRLEMGVYQEIVGYLTDDLHPDNKPPEEKNYRAMGTFDELKKVIAENEVSMVLADQSKVTWKRLRMTAEICSDAMVNFRMIPNTFDLWVDQLNLRVHGGVPVMGVNALVFDRFGSRFIKRMMDIAGALVGLVLAAPVIGILAILIYRESPGPIFYLQTRLGLRDKPFRMIKLRSMRADAEKESGAVWTVDSDPRRIKIGAFMRAWNLDELPQFWNVLRGEMSLVGPRPERPEFVKDFRTSVRYYNLRHSLKPGVTGWAAVHGFRGNTSLEDRLDYDLYYIENWSPLLDIRIMLMTLAPPKNAY